MLKGASERLSLHPYFKHAPDSRFVFLTYAAVRIFTRKTHSLTNPTSFRSAS
mgnify:FL=1